MAEKTDKPTLNPNCPCTKRDCPRNRNCEECKAAHHSKGGKTTCERLEAEKQKAEN